VKLITQAVCLIKLHHFNKVSVLVSILKRNHEWNGESKKCKYESIAVVTSKKCKYESIVVHIVVRRETYLCFVGSLCNSS